MRKRCFFIIAALSAALFAAGMLVHYQAGPNCGKWYEESRVQGDAREEKSVFDLPIPVSLTFFPVSRTVEVSFGGKDQRVSFRQVHDEGASDFRKRFRASGAEFAITHGDYTLTCRTGPNASGHELLMTIVSAERRGIVLRTESLQEQKILFDRKDDKYKTGYGSGD